MPDDSAAAARLHEAAVLVDYDNFFKDEPATETLTTARLNTIVSGVFGALPDVDRIDIRLYGGWLEDGILTNRASELQTSLGRPFFPLIRPLGRGLTHGSITLVTRLVAVPGIEWAHTYRRRFGLPRLRLVDRPRPSGCAQHHSCPIDQVQRMSRRQSRECHAEGCSVRNEDAFVLAEQKLVDSLICCDTVAYATRDVALFLLSNDLDVLPALAMARAVGHPRVFLARGADGSQALYDEDLEALGVEPHRWEAA